MNILAIIFLNNIIVILMSRNKDKVKEQKNITFDA